MDTAMYDNDKQQAQSEEVQGKFCEAEHYTFSPSISKRKIVDSKAFYVRRFFTGGKDLEKTMERLAARQAYNKNAG
jgi:hypothetical protein